MRGRIPKVPNFPAIQNQQQEASTVSHSEKPTNSYATKTAAKQPQRSSERNRRSPSYYGFESPSPDSTIARPPKRPRRAGDVENYQPAPPKSIVEAVQHIADQQPTEINISPRLGEVSPPAPRDPQLLDIDTPTLVSSMTVFEAEGHDLYE